MEQDASVLARWRLWWRRNWESLLAVAFLQTAPIVPVAIIVVARLRGKSLSPELVAALGAASVLLLSVAILLFAREVLRQDRSSEMRLRHYVEGLRRYAVESIEPMRQQLDALGAERVPIPLAEVPVASDDVDRELKTRERDTLLRILYGMACAKPYSFDPSAKRGEAAVTIASATAAAGCSVDPDSVRKYLKLAAEKFGEPRGASR